jgi:hypothetical protein
MVASLSNNFIELSIGRPPHFNKENTQDRDFFLQGWEREESFFGKSIKKKVCWGNCVTEMKEAEPCLGLPQRAMFSEYRYFTCRQPQLKQTAEKMHAYSRDILHGHLQPSSSERNR